ncbi:MAG TPA: hypothetical protein VG367_18755 [Mucilaginibacter sp.]|jgi:hypothetical protein|nr:hypothetical protein [Mucilaginibacter sp.]
MKRILKSSLPGNNLVVKKVLPEFGKPHSDYLWRMKPADINNKWKALQERIAADFDTDKPDVKVMLFLIGVQELGKGPRKFSKRQKEELMHIATCRLFSQMGFYELEGLDQDGWPHWKLVDKIPNYTMLEQEMILKSLIIDYFEDLS